MNNRLFSFDERTAPIDSIIIHCSAFPARQAIETFREAQVSAHYIIDFNGKIIPLVDEDKRAWHAGKSFWRGRESLNNCSIGIEICHSSLGQSAYDIRQIKSLIRLCQRLMRKYHIKAQNMLGHSDIAPARKADPGKCFPWPYLARHGIGRWYNIKNAALITENNVDQLLKLIGYDTTDITAAEWAFCRHYLPETVPVETDISYLVNHPYPQNFEGNKNLFIQALQAVAYEFSKYY